MVWQEKSKEYRENIRLGSIKYHKSHSISDETRNRISKSISIPICQYSSESIFIKTYESATIAGIELGIDPSCIIKCS